MKGLRLVILVALACAITGWGARPVHGAASPLLSIAQSELQRNFGGLNKEPVPPYFISYTLHDMRTTRISAAFGALQRSDEARNRFVTVDVRVGDYALDNTHPLRGDTNPSRPRVSAVALPLTDDPKPIRLALWRATDRSFKQAAEALTRVKTNVAAKIKDDNPVPDFSREEPQTYTGVSRRCSLTIHWYSTATCRSRSSPTTATTPAAAVPRLPPGRSPAGSSSRR
jgi:TldD protein